MVPIMQSESEHCLLKALTVLLTVPTISACSSEHGNMEHQTWKIQAMKEQNENIGELFIWPPSWGEISKHTSKAETPKEKHDRPDWVKTSKPESITQKKGKGQIGKKMWNIYDGFLPLLCKTITLQITEKTHTLKRKAQSTAGGP